MATLAPTASECREGAPGLLAGEGALLVNWIAVWVLCANAAFMAMWFVGAPPRAADILFIGVAGLVLRKKSRSVQFAGFLAMMVYSAAHFISGLFNLTLTSLIFSLRYLIELDSAQSIEYIVAGGVLGLSCLAAWTALGRPTGFSGQKPLLAACAAVFALAGADYAMGMGMRGHYMRSPAAGAPFESALRQSGLIVPGVKPERNVMLVMVEALGVPQGNAEMSRLLFARYDDPAVRSRFEISRGTTTYYNSTTAGEVRELCGRWGDYYDLLDRSDPTCLPARLAEMGMSTHAYHSFTGDFFDRAAWYPNIGFAEQSFAAELVAGGAEMCGGVFPGACDRDVPRQLTKQLKGSDGPQFVYWLTLNTHLPVPHGGNLGAGDCSKLAPGLAADYPMICRQFALWDDLDAALIGEITASDFPPTDILLVGDHMPPYFDRHQRRQWAPDRVPWMLLRWRGGEAK